MNDFKMKIQYLLLAFLCSTVISFEIKPHIIIFMLDDLGFRDYGFMGSNQIRTPNIDALAFSGTILNRHYTLPTCTPSRSAFLTGIHPIHYGMQGYPLKGGENRSLPLWLKIQPQYFKDLGYKTYLLGKWHLGFQKNDHTPNSRGFDSFFGFYNGYIDFFNFNYRQTLDNGKVFDGIDLRLDDLVLKGDSASGEYITNLLTRKAQHLIKNHDTSEPLYLMVSHAATHAGNDNVMGMQPPSDVNINEEFSHIKHTGRRAFASVLAAADNSIGVIVKELNSKKMLKNSIILVLSDNGGHTVSVDMSPNWSSNWPLLGTKFTLFEGGVRCPAVLWTPYLPKGILIEDFMQITDWLPTLYTAAGAKNPLKNIDGIDQWQYLMKGKTKSRDSMLLNINEKIDSEGIIINNKFKVVKGGFPNYGNYEYHWGKEENVKSNIEYDYKAVRESLVGKIVSKFSAYNTTFLPYNMKSLRDRMAVNCSGPEPNVRANNNYVKKNNSHRCADYCIFDLIQDPCELRNIRKTFRPDMLWEKILKDYKSKMVKQKYTNVDLNSNPKNFNGVWQPWEKSVYEPSKASTFSIQYLNISILVTLSWYLFLRKK